MQFPPWISCATLALKGIGGRTRKEPLSAKNMPALSYQGMQDSGSHFKTWWQQFRGFAQIHFLCSVFTEPWASHSQHRIWWGGQNGAQGWSSSSVRAKVTLCASRKNFRSAECNYSGWKGAKILALTSPLLIEVPRGQNYGFLHCWKIRAGEVDEHVSFVSSLNCYRGGWKSS